MVLPARRSHTARFAVLGAIGILTAFAVTACTPSADTASTPTSATTSTTGSSSTAAPKPVATPSDPPTPVSLTCDQILSPDQLQAFNPDFAADPGYTPKTGSKAAQIASYKGVVCGFLDQTSNSVIEVAVAKPSAGQLTAQKNTAITRSHVVPTYGIPPKVEGYFTVSSGIGEVQVFTGGWWLVVSSQDFAEPGAPQPLVASVVQNLSAH